MGTLSIINSTLDISYEYRNESIVISGSYRKSNSTGVLQTFSGTVYRVLDGDQTEYMGTFSGQARGGKMCYSINEMPRADIRMVQDALDEIEPQITGGEEGGES